MVWQFVSYPPHKVKSTASHCHLTFEVLSWRFFLQSLDISSVAVQGFHWGGQEVAMMMQD
jgi:hypothetical protein